MEPKSLIRNRFKTPEGRCTLVAERLAGVSFASHRSTRITLARLSSNVTSEGVSVAGSPTGNGLVPEQGEDGLWVLYNVAEMLHITRLTSIHKDPVRSLSITSNTRAFPCCHAFAPAKDGIDTLVALTDGTVYLLSLRAQLLGNNKLVIAGMLQPEITVDNARCSAVHWVPRSEGIFVAAFSSGTVYVYKKSTILGEGNSRFSLGLGSGNKSTNPVTTLVVSGGGITDLSVSPCGTKLAAACRDGAVRLLELATGTVVGGFFSYYGVPLCCSFSPDGRYVASGGEDDLVTVYGVVERGVVWHCQGHNSWVTRVQWDSHVQGPLSAAIVQADQQKLYRMASVGQDTELCLWDVPTDADSTALVSTGTLRKASSIANLSMGAPLRTSAEAAAMHVSGGALQHQASTHMRKPSVSKLIGSIISPALAHSEMNILQPCMQHRVHSEPMSDVAFTTTFLLTADHGGCLRLWERPPVGNQRLSVQRSAMLSAATEADGSAC